jgi:hypothetical protein
MALTDDEHDRLIEILRGLSEAMSRMRPKDRDFVEEQQKRYDEAGTEMWLSRRQWEWLESLYERHA